MSKKTGFTATDGNASVHFPEAIDSESAARMYVVEGDWTWPSQITVAVWPGAPEDHGLHQSEIFSFEDGRLVA